MGDHRVDPRVDRRTFLGMAGAAGAGTLAIGVPQVAGATVPGARASLLAHTLEVERKLLTGSRAPMVDTAAGWQADKLFNQAAATLLWSARTQRTPRGAREAQAFQHAVDARIDSMLRTTWAFGLELDGLDDAGVRASEQEIIAHAQRLEAARYGFTAQAIEAEMEGKAVERIDRMYERAIWRVKRRGLAAVRDDMLFKLDRYGKREGIDWREAARMGAELPFAYEMHERDDVAGLPPEQARNYEALFDRARRQSTTGGVMLGIGILWMAGPQIIFGGICFGPPLIIVGAVKLAAAGKKRRTAREIRAMYPREPIPGEPE